MKTKIVFFVFASFAIFLFTRCTSKGDSITEPKFGTFKFTTYTIDTFRFKVILNGEVLTDSLLSPQSSFSRIVSFFKSTARLLILDAENQSQVILDSVIQMKIGNTNISIVQFGHNEKPSPPPLFNEPLPAEGNYKVRFQYIRPSSPAVPFFDSIRCIIKKNGVEIDRIVLEKYESSPFYEAISATDQFTMSLENPAITGSNNVIDPILQNIGDLTGLNTAIVFGTSSTTNPNNPYNYTLKYAY